MSFIKGFMSLFDWFPESKSYKELSDNLDNDMQKLYDQMGWGKYNNPLKQTLILDKNGQLTTLAKDMEKNISKQSIDPARLRISKYYHRSQYK